MRKMCKDCDHKPVCCFPYTENTIGCDYWKPLEKNGRWEIYFDGKYIMCSACKASFWSEDGETTNYCPNCGAKMMEENFGCVEDCEDEK